MTYSQAIKSLINWYLIILIPAFVGAVIYLRLGYPEHLWIHLLGTFYLLGLGNHMCTGSIFLSPKGLER